MADMEESGVIGEQPPCRSDASGGALRRNELLFLASFLLLAFGWKYLSINSHTVVSADGTSYSMAGKLFFEDWNFKRFGTVFPPVYPLLIGLFNLVFDDLEFSSRIVSVLFSTLTVIPAYLLGRIRLGAIGGIVIAVLFTSLPIVQAMSAVDIAEPVFTFFMLSGGVLVWFGLQAGGVFPARLFLGGLSLGLAYLSRPEGFVGLFSLSLVMLLICFPFERKRLRRTVAGLLMAWGGFFTVAFPYMAYIHDMTGKWQLSGKTDTCVTVIKEIKGLTTYDQRFRLDEKGEPLEQKGSLVDLIRTEPKLYLSILKMNIANFFSALGEVFPVYLWPLVLAGFLFSPWRGEDLRLKAVVAGLLSPSLLYIIFYVDKRNFYPYLPLMIYFIAALLVEAGRRLESRTAIRQSWLPLVFTLVLSGYYIIQEIPKPRPPYHFLQDGGKYDDKQIGLRLKSILPRNAVLMTRSPRIPYYAGMPSFIPPQAEPEQIFAYARKNRVTHLVVNMLLRTARPQLEFLFTPLMDPGAPFTPPKELELVYMGEEPGGMPYLIYRFR